MSARPPVIGLVGGIGSGKSTVAECWREAGCVVSDSDRLAREALEDPEVRRRLVDWWGPGVIGSDDRVDRRAVGRIVFGDPNDPKERRRLEELVHPKIELARRAAFAAAPRDAPAFVIDAPLLLEAGLDRACDVIVFVDAPREERLARLVRNRGWNAQELARREAAQWPLDLKRSKAHHVLRNAGDVPALRTEARRLLDQILCERTGASPANRREPPH